MTKHEAEILALQKYPDEKSKFWGGVMISYKREREEYVKWLLTKSRKEE